VIGARSLRAVGRGTVVVVNWINSRSPFVTTLATVVIAILTFYYVRYSRDQWKAMNTQTQIADATLKQIRYEDRPWMTVVSVLPTVVETDKQIEGVITLINSGKSPALDTTADANMYITSDLYADVTPLAGIPENEVMHDLVGPNTQRIISVHSKDKPNSIQAKRLKQPDVRYYFYGIITYKDNVTVHRTEFCYYTFSGLNGMNGCVGKQYKNTAN
jgi:hypothetical protein